MIQNATPPNTVELTLAVKVVLRGTRDVHVTEYFKHELTEALTPTPEVLNAALADAGIHAEVVNLSEITNKYCTLSG